ncbi:MAG: hypothetical protein WA885_05865 [Phormidesmis sp.]
MGELRYRDEQSDSFASCRGANRNTSDFEGNSLAYDQTYGCPACGSGELSAIALMDVFACSFCRHLFTANLQTQSVHLADSLQPMAWHWNGWRWRTAQQGETAAAFIWGFCGALALAPVAIIALSNYIFPPLDRTDFPLIWIGMTLLSHGIISGWLLAEYHRWPWYISARIRLQRLRERWLTAEQQ